MCAYSRKGFERRAWSGCARASGRDLRVEPDPGAENEQGALCTHAASLAVRTPPVTPAVANLGQCGFEAGSPVSMDGLRRAAWSASTPSAGVAQLASPSLR